MKLKTLSFLFLFSFIITQPFNGICQNTDVPEYNAALNAYVQGLLIDFNKDAIDRERFLVQQIRMLNDEIKSRISGTGEIKRKYFERLDDRLDELQSLKGRLGRSSSLSRFIDELERNLKETIKSGTINYKQQRVIEDAMQLLYVAEEMYKLDPNASVEEDPKFSKDFSKAQTSVMNTFGEKEWLQQQTDRKAPAEETTIYTVYSEWKNTERVKYQLRWTDIQIIKNRLIKNGKAVDKERMLKRELQHAAEMYNFGFYDLAERSFSEILSRYAFAGQLDDCLFYKAESNYRLARYLHAEKDFSNFTKEYPASVFMPQVYKRLIRIAYHFGNYEQVLTYLRTIRATMSSSDRDYEEFLLMGAIAAQRSSQFEQVVSFTSEIPPASLFYHEARFLMGEAYAGSANLTEAINTFKALDALPGLEPDFHFTILLKLGYLHYESGNYEAAIGTFDQIAGNFKQYDRVLVGYGWSYYKIELAKSVASDRDFTFAKRYLELLRDEFTSSDYTLEAQTLLGYIYQLESKADKAITNFEKSFQAKESKLLSDQLNQERDAMKEVMFEAQSLERRALASNNPEAYQRARAMRERIEEPLQRLSYLDLSSSGVATNNEIARLNDQLAELEKLKATAQEKVRPDVVKRIEDLQMRIYNVVNSVPMREKSPLGINYFDEQPLARKVSVIENENNKTRLMRQDLQQQRDNITQQIARLDVGIEQARNQKDYRQMINMELSQQRFEDLLKKLDYLETRSYALAEKPDRINLNRWSDYGAFGMTNVRFAIKNMKAGEISYMQQQIEEINYFLETRKSNIEHKIEQIDNEIVLMTRRVREQERIREREELNRQFEKSYFDTHDTELNYDIDTTQPPAPDQEPSQQ